MSVPSRTTILDLVERSVIVQALVTLGLVGTVIYLSATQQPVSDLLAQLTLLSLGFYFGSRVENSKAAAYLARHQ